jgi:precorrin-2 methylase
VNKHFILDKEYEKRAADVIMRALMEDMMDPETRQCLWKTGELTEVFLNLQAMLLADSQMSDTPTKLREFTDDYAKRLRRKVNEAKVAFVTVGKPFETLRIDGELH